MMDRPLHRWKSPYNVLLENLWVQVCFCTCFLAVMTGGCKLSRLSRGILRSWPHLFIFVSIEELIFLVVMVVIEAKL